jgi:hypothetical protein
MYGLYRKEITTFTGDGSKSVKRVLLKRFARRSQARFVRKILKDEVRNELGRVSGEYRDEHKTTALFSNWHTVHIAYEVRKM